MWLSIQRLTGYSEIDAVTLGVDKTLIVYYLDIGRSDHYVNLTRPRIINSNQPGQGQTPLRLICGSDCVLPELRSIAVQRHRYLQDRQGD